VRKLLSYTLYTVVVDSTLPPVLVCVVVRTEYPVAVFSIRCTCDRMFVVVLSIVDTVISYSVYQYICVCVAAGPMCDTVSWE